MTRPTRHPEFGTYYLRTRVPHDLVERVKGRSIRVPVGDRIATVKVGEAVKVSLGTKNATEAKKRTAAALEALGRIWEAERSGPAKLTNKQIQTLAGIFYRGLAEGFEEEPGNPAIWQRVRTTNKVSGDGEILGRFGIGDEVRNSAKRRAMEERFGNIADALLDREGLRVDRGSRDRLLAALKDASGQAARKLERNTKGDYRPDPDAERFPQVPREGIADKAGGKASVTITGLFDKWKVRKERQGASPRSARRWEPVIRQFVDFLGHDDAARVSTDDVIAWREKLYEDGRVSVDTFRKTNRAALNSVFALGVDLRLLPHNPVKAVKTEKGRKTRVRERGFTDEEAQRILRAATRAAENPGRAGPWTLRARRWVPWLCAYSGARVTEMTQLRKEDVVRVEGVDCIRITPEAGRVKTGEYRLVPLHPHMVEQGFLEFVRGAKAGPLFYDPKRKSDDPAEETSNSLRRWVRSDAVGVTDKNVQPNHGWRHRFKNVASRAGISDRVSHHITGHAQGTEGGRYGDAEVPTMWEAIKRLPRYEV